MTETKAGARTRTITWEDPALGLAKAAEMSGLEFIRAMFDGKVPPPPITATMGLFAL